MSARPLLILLLACTGLGLAQQNRAGFKPVLSFALNKEQPVKLSALHGKLAPLARENGFITFGFRQKNLFLYRVEFSNPTPQTQGYISAFESETINQQQFYILSQGPQVYCQLKTALLVCANDFSALITRLKPAYEKALLYSKNLGYYILAQRLDSQSSTLRQWSKLSLEDTPILEGTWQKEQQSYRLNFKLPENRLTRLIRSQASVQSEKITLPLRSESLLTWQQAGQPWRSLLKKAGFNSGQPRWFQQDKYLVRVNTNKAPVFAYRMNSIEKEKKRRLPRQQARQFFKRYKRGNFLIYRLAWKKKQVFTVFHDKHMYLLNDEATLAELVKNNARVKVEPHYFQLRSVLKKSAFTRPDDLFFYELLKSNSEFSITIDKDLENLGLTISF